MNWQKRDRASWQTANCQTTGRQAMGRQSVAWQAVACVALTLAAGCAGVVGHKHSDRPDCVCFPRGACAGFYSTCWRLWPEECASCPVSGGPIIPDGQPLPAGPFSAPAGEPSAPAGNSTGPAELITPPEPPKPRSPLLAPPDAARSGTKPTSVAERQAAANAPVSPVARTTGSNLGTPTTELKTAPATSQPSRPVIKSFTLSPTKQITVAPTKEASPSTKKVTVAPTKQVLLSPPAPAVSAAWEERVAAPKTAATEPRRAPASLHPIVSAAPRHHLPVVEQRLVAERDGQAAPAESLPSPMERRVSTASRPTIKTPPRQSRPLDRDQHGFGVAPSRPADTVLPPRAIDPARAPINPTHRVTAPTAAHGNLPSPHHHRWVEDLDESARLRIVSEVRPLPPVQQRPVVHSVETRRDSVVVRDDRIEKLPAIGGPAPARAPVRLVERLPVVRPAVR
jgi:hypothetical protein